MRLVDSLIRGYEGWSRREGFVIEPTECLSVCPRPCGIALRAPHKHVYVFGDVPVDAAEQVIECATAYRRSETGEMPRAARPPALRAEIMARVPPADAD